MPSIFKKLFGRKAKSAENGGILTTKNTKNAKKDKKLKQKKKKDKLAHFPSKEQPLAASHDFSSNLVDEDSKENIPIGHNLTTALPTGEPSGAPTRDPRAAPTGDPTGDPSRNSSRNSSRNPSGDPSGDPNGDPNGDPVGDPNGDGQTSEPASEAAPSSEPPPRSEQASSPREKERPREAKEGLLSAMSGNKPPLTPNRGARAMKPLAPSNRSLPTEREVDARSHAQPAAKENEKPSSPDNSSLRGVHMAGSGASDDMCLSSDADDEDYNRIVHSENPPPGKTKEKFVSALDRSSFSYASDDDNALFPALVDDKDPFVAQDPPRAAPPKPHKDIFPMAHETQEDIRAWTPSPTKKPSFTFGTDKIVSPSARAATPSARQKPSVLFENFRDFEPFDPEARNFNKSSKSANPCSPVSALLDESREKRRRSRNLDYRNGTSSINSAPVVTASYVRQQLAGSKQVDTSASISRVIDNLELHVNKHQLNAAMAKENSSFKDFASEASSQHSKRSTESAIREAKERLRSEGVANESKMIDLLASGSGGATGKHDGWLFDEVAGTLGPRSVAADLESLGGRSNRSGLSRNSHGNKSHRSHRSKHRRHKSRDGGDISVDSRTSRNSRNSYRSYQTTKSMVSQMSEQSRSVANDLLRLEAQLSMVGKKAGGSGSSVSASDHGKRRDDCGMTVTSRDFSRGSGGGLPRPERPKHISASARRAAAVTLRSKITVVAPPGKLGIILANRTDSRGTVVSGVRTSSVLADQVSPGDRIIAIDDEDVSQMNVKEITTIMARKSEFERVMVLLAAPKQQYD